MRSCGVRRVVNGVVENGKYVGCGVVEYEEGSADNHGQKCCDTLFTFIQNPAFPYSFISPSFHKCVFFVFFSQSW